jgi:hypothetical protein
VGVVADTKVGGRDEPDKEQWYIPALQSGTLNGYDTGGQLTRATRGYVTSISRTTRNRYQRCNRTRHWGLSTATALRERGISAAVFDSHAGRPSARLCADATAAEALCDECQDNFAAGYAA